MGFEIENGILKKYIEDDGVTEVVPDGVTSIGWGAFRDCTSLTSVTIPEGLIDIGDYAFFGCESLASITIPDSVTSIGKDAFSDTAYFKNETNWENDVLYIDNHLIKVKNTISGAYTIKDGTKTIAGSAFYYCTSLESITIPEGVIDIGDYAFFGCESLTKVIIPDSVKNIGEYAFIGINSLNVKVSKNVNHIVSGSWILSCEDRSYRAQFDSSFESFEMHISEESKNCFGSSGKLLVLHGKRNLIEKRDIPEAKLIVAPEIECISFKNSKQKFAALLGYLSKTDLYTEQAVIDSYESYFLKSKKKILEVAFNDDNVNIMKKLVESGKANVKNIDKDFIIPAQTAKAQKCVAFLLDWQSKNISIDEKEKEEMKSFERELKKDPNSKAELKKRFSFREKEDGTLEVYSYKDKENLNVVIPKEICGQKVTSVTFMNNFPLKKLIKSISLPKGIKEIPEKAFVKCESLESITIPESVTSIGGHAFEECHNLKSIVLPSSVKFIGERAFEDCFLLSSIEFGNGLEQIGAYALKSCKSLFTIELPSSLNIVNQRAFYNCHNVTDMYFLSKNVSFENGVFQDCSRRMNIHGYANSTVEKQAKKSGYCFIPIEANN